MKLHLPSASRLAESEIQRSEDTHKIKLIWSTGYKGLRSGFDGKFYEELEMTPEACDLTRLNNGAPVLAQHDTSVASVIGVVNRAWIEDGLGYAEITLSKRSDVQGLVQDVIEGILRNISVGYQVSKYQDVTRKGDDVKTYRATRWHPQELSVCAIAFDPYAQTLRESQNENEVEIITSQETDMKTEDTPAAEAVTETRAAAPVEETQPAPIEPTIDLEAVKRQAIEEFQTRSEEIRLAVKAAGLATELADELISRGLSTADASKEIFKSLEANSASQNKSGANSRKEKEMTKREMAEAALLNRIDGKRFQVEAQNPFKQARFIDLIEAVVERNAGETDSQFTKRALVSSDLAELLANTANKVMGQQGGGKFTYQKWCGAITLRDFKETPIIQMGAYSLAAKTEGGDYAEATMSDSDEKITLRERGIRFSISQKAIMNDDLGALKNLPMHAQAAGHRDIEATVYGILNSNPTMSDAKTLFHADHGNLIATAGGVPSVASVEAVNLLLAAQADSNSNPLDLRAKYLIVPPQYEMEARQVASATLVPSSAGNVNPYAGDLDVIVSSRISGNVWYAAADKEEMAAIVTATLEGQPEPTVSTEEHFRSSNLDMKVEFPNAAAAATYKSIVKVVV